MAVKQKMVVGAGATSVVMATVSDSMRDWLLMRIKKKLK